MSLRLDRSAPSRYEGLRLVGWSSGGSMTAPVRETKLHYVRHIEHGEPEDTIEAQHSAICGRSLPRLSRWDFSSHDDVSRRGVCKACTRAATT